jgi:hypothetical protein
MATSINPAELAKHLHEDLDLEVLCHSFYGEPIHRLVVLGPDNDRDILIDDTQVVAAKSNDHDEVADSIANDGDVERVLGFIAAHLGLGLAKPRS